MARTDNRAAIVHPHLSTRLKVQRMRARDIARLVLANLMILLALAILGLATAEAYLRITIPASSGGTLFQSTLATRRFKVMRPNTRIVAFGSDFRTNSDGFRADRDFTPKAPGTYRVIVLGDSFTASAGVDLDRIYTSLLQQELSAVLPTVEVLNLAVGGYNPIQEELVLKEVGFALQPDLIVVATFPFNDLSNEDYRANERDAVGQSTAARKRPFYSDLYVYRAFLRRLWSRLATQFFPRPEHSPAEIAAAAALAIQDANENLEALESIVRSTREAGIDAVIVLLPNTDDFADQRATFEPFLSRCASRSWTCLDLLGTFESSGASPSSLRLNALDPHPNSDYNAIVAHAIAGYLKPIVLGRNSEMQQRQGQ